MIMKWSSRFTISELYRKEHNLSVTEMFEEKIKTEYVKPI